MSRRPNQPIRAARLGAIGFTVLALLLTGITAVLLARVLRSTKYNNEPTRGIVVAAEAILPGEEILAEHLKIVRWPASSIPEGSFRTVDTLLDGERRVPVISILAGEPIVLARLASEERGSGLASLIPANQRAFPVPVDGWVSKSRLVYPGAEVDILATLRDPVERRSITKLILQKIQVLAVDGVVDPAKQPKKKAKGLSRRDKKIVVTLLVTPAQAETLALAVREGKIDLALRNATDGDEVTTAGITATVLLQNLGAKTAKKPAAKSRPARRYPPSVARDLPPRRSGSKKGIKTIKLGAR